MNGLFDVLHVVRIRSLAIATCIGDAHGHADRSLAVGPFAVRWYALAYIAGLFGGLWYMRWLVKRPPALITPAQIDDLIEKGRVAADTRTIVARSGLAFVVKAGARKPDVGTVEAFKRTLLDAKSITYTKEGVSGVLFAAIISKLGIVDALAPKTEFTSVGEEASANVVAGRAELGVLPVSEILPVRGAKWLGPVPRETQVPTSYSAAIGAGRKAAAQGATLAVWTGYPELVPWYQAVAFP